MPYFCLYFPTLASDLARSSRPGREEQPLVLIQGAGEAALVTAASPLALARGVAPGMRAAEARCRCRGALFLPDNAGACLDEMERLAAILRRYATGSVAIGGRDHLFVRLDDGMDPATTAHCLLALSRSWCRHEARAGAGSSPVAALRAARLARRAPVVAEGPLDLPGTQGPRLSFGAGELSGRAALPGEDVVVLRRQLVALLTRLEALLAGRAQGFREARVEVETAAGSRSLRLRFERPAYAASELLARLDHHLHAPALAAATAVTVRLSRLCPDVRERGLPRPEPLPAAG